MAMAALSEALDPDEMVFFEFEEDDNAPLAKPPDSELALCESPVKVNDGLNSLPPRAVSTFVKNGTVESGFCWCCCP